MGASAQSMGGCLFSFGFRVREIITGFTQGTCALVVGPHGRERPVDGRLRADVGPVGGADALDELGPVQVARVALLVRQAHVGVDHEPAVPQAQVVVAQQAALARRALPPLVAPAFESVEN